MALLLIDHKAQKGVSLEYLCLQLTSTYSNRSCIIYSSSVVVVDFPSACDSFQKRRLPPFPTPTLCAPEFIPTSLRSVVSDKL